MTGSGCFNWSSPGIILRAAWASSWHGCWLLPEPVLWAPGQKNSVSQELAEELRHCHLYPISFVTQTNVAQCWQGQHKGTEAGGSNCRGLSQRLATTHCKGVIKNGSSLSTPLLQQSASPCHSPRKFQMSEANWRNYWSISQEEDLWLAPKWPISPDLEKILSNYLGLPLALVSIELWSPGASPGPLKP